MKRLFFVLFLFCSLTAMSQEKQIRLNAYASYVFDDRVESYYSNTSYYNGVVEGGLKWGGGLEFMVQPLMGVELIYLTETTTAPTQYYWDDGIGDPVKNRDFDVHLQYIMLGGNRYVKPKPNLETFFGFQLGVGIVDVNNPTTGEENSTTKFAWGLKLGTNIWASEKFGIKLQAGLISLAQAAGGSIYFGAGGVSPGLSTYSSILQFSLGGGLVMRLK